MTGASRPSRRAGKRALAALAAGSIAVPLSFGMLGGTAFAAEGDAEPPQPVAIDTVCPPDSTPDANFPDTQDNFFKDSISCIAAYAVAEGFPDDLYHPERGVNREQMALFFYRVGLAASVDWDTTDAGYPDINTASTDEARDAINALTNAGIVEGFTDNNYKPLLPLHRDEMAKFIANTIEFISGVDLSTTNDYYTDDADDFFEQFINEITAARVSNGIDGHDIYDPHAGMPRDQMAGFVARTMEVLAENGDLQPQFGNVTLSSNSVQQGGTLTGTVNGTNATVNGCGLTDQALTDTDTTTDGIQFSVTIPQSQPAGDCTLTFNFTDTSGQAQTVTRTITVTQAASNQTITVTPDTTAVQDVNTSRSFTATAPAGTVVDLRLFPAADVTNTNGTFTFKDANGDNQADENPSPADITVVGGVDVADAQEIDNITVPSSGQLTFTVSSPAEADVYPVVWADPTTANGGNDTLDLAVPSTSNTNPKAPKESFGVGGETIFAAAEAALGAHNGITVDTVNRANDFFTDGTNTYYYDSNDTYQFGGVTITMAQFEGLLTNGDMLDVAYNPDSAGVSTFNVTDDVVPPATNATATVVDSDSDGAFDDVTVKWAASAQPDAVYDVYRDNVTANDTPEAAELVSNNVSGTSITLTNQPNGTYNYIVVAQSTTTGASSSSALTNDVTVPGSAAANPAPFAVDNVITSNGGFIGTFDAGDVFKVVFDEVMAAPDSGDTIRAIDGDNTVADFINGTNATFTLNAAAETVNGLSRPAGTVLTVTLTGAPDVVTAGTAAGLQVPATVTDQSGNTDTSGKAWDLTVTPQDLLIDQDADDNDAVAGAPTATIQAADGASTFTITFDEPMDNTSLACTDLTITDADAGAPAPTCGAITWNANNTVATVAVGNENLATGDTITLAQDSVNDAAGNSGPPAAVTKTV